MRISLGFKERDGQSEGGGMDSALPKQAVILAGGRGTRLLEITKDIPKPMVPFHGKPFLEYLLVYLKDQGISEFLILLGYLSETVIEYFGDGEKWGISITYDVTSVDNDTGRRIELATPKIQEEFLLCYCDNYCPLPLEQMAVQWRESGLDAQATIYTNFDGYTKSNLRVEDAKVTVYDKTRTTPNLQGVEIGFLFAKKTVLTHFPVGENRNFEREVFPQLIASGQLGAFETEHRYYSVGKPERLPLTEEFLKFTPTIFLDRDGVLNHKAPRGCYIESWADWRWAEGAKEAVAALTEAGYRIILISNQAGIARGCMSVESVEDIHRNMCREIEEQGGRIDAIYYCPHHWDDGCRCRKPDIGMFLQASRDFHIDVSQTVFIGDDERDGFAAERAGCGFIRIDEDTSLLDASKRIIG